MERNKEKIVSLPGEDDQEYIDSLKKELEAELKLLKQRLKEVYLDAIKKAEQKKLNTIKKVKEEWEARIKKSLSEKEAKLQKKKEKELLEYEKLFSIAEGKLKEASVLFCSLVIGGCCDNDSKDVSS